MCNNFEMVRDRM